MRISISSQGAIYCTSFLELGSGDQVWQVSISSLDLGREAQNASKKDSLLKVTQSSCCCFGGSLLS